MNKPYQTTEDLIKLLRCSRVTLWRYVRAGVLHPIKIGRCYYFPTSEVKEKFEPCILS
jgi:predicted DNA-binding transcriptional regulator AlpA